MGNRAVIQFGKGDDAMGIYLHWNGGEESVKAFLDAARAYGVREDDDYCVARVAQIIGNFFGGVTSVGVALAKNLDQDNGDNGTFIIEGLDIVDYAYPDAKTRATQCRKFDEKYYKGVLEETRKRNDAAFIKEVA